MILWLDAQLSPRLAGWIAETFDVECLHIRDLGLRDAEDPEIFQKAGEVGSVVMTKDEDFVWLIEQRGPPPAVVWITSGNMPNARFKSLLLKTLQDALSLIAAGESIVEIHRLR